MLYSRRAKSTALTDMFVHISFDTGKHWAANLVTPWDNVWAARSQLAKASRISRNWGLSSAGACVEGLRIRDDFRLPWSGFIQLFKGGWLTAA